LCPVFFGHLTPDVEDLRHQHRYHPVPVEEKAPELANVLNHISAGTFGDADIFEP
jgi:starch phosphorylase